MTNFARKMRRKKQGTLMRDLKKRMKQLKTMVKCITCGRKPSPGEAIDNWAIKDAGTSGISLMCTGCYSTLKGGEDEI